jgi:hypothetical protein
MKTVSPVRLVVAALVAAAVLFVPVFQTGYAATNAPATSIARIYIDADGRVHIVQGDGQKIAPPKERDQVSVASAAVASDNLTAGWLVEYGNCCSSYPIPLTLVFYRPGRPLRRLGNGMMICGWQFEAGGKQVAFSTNTVHGDLAPHYELRDTQTGRLLDKWDGHLNNKAPSWATRLK